MREITPHGAGILDDVVITDISQEVAGPVCARILAEMGADVIHVEPLRGDNGRFTSTPFLGEEGIFHQVVNRSKRSLSLSLENDNGREVLARLIAHSDVVIDGLRPGTLAKLGFTYETMADSNPRLIYARLSGYGGRGPLSHRPGYDVVLQGFSGVVTMNEALEPALTGFLYGDTSAPLLMSTAILSALIARARNGRGQSIDVSLLDGIVHMMCPSLLWVEDDPVLSGATKRDGVKDPTTGVFQAAGGSWLVVAAFNDRQFQALFEAFGLEELAHDPRYATRQDRVTASDEIYGLAGGMFLTRPAGDWEDLLVEHGVPCAEIRMDRRRLLDEPQLWANDMLVEIEHPTKGKMRLPGVPFRLSDTPCEVRSPAPRLGEHSRDVLAELGYSHGQVESLVRGGVVNAFDDSKIPQSNRE